MTFKKTIRLSGVLVLILICGFAWKASQESLSHIPDYQPDSESDLYLPKAEYLKFISLGHNGLVSDFILARALTYYGSHYKERQTFKFRHLKSLFVTAVEMDPMNREALLMAGNLLAPVDIQSAIDVLKLGMFYHPMDWKFPEMIGFFYYFRLNRTRLAARYYELAAKLPGHPPYVPSISSKLYEEAGRYREAIRVLYNFYSTTNDKRLKQVFKDSIDEIQKKIDSHN